MILHKSNKEKLKIIQPREKLKTIQLYNEKLKIIQPRGKVPGKSQSSSQYNTL